MSAEVDTSEINRIYEAYLVHGSMQKTAVALGIPRHKVVRAIYRTQGRCQCGRPPVEGFVNCQVCLDRAKRNSKRLHTDRIANGTCRECGDPLAATSAYACEKHLAMGREQLTRLRQKRISSGTCRFCKEPTVDGKPFCEKHLRYAAQKSIESRSRVKFGGLLFAVLERDSSTCQICGKKSEERRIEVHHIHSRENTMENLISLCVYCHKVITFLNHCDEPEKTYSFFLAHRP